MFKLRKAEPRDVPDILRLIKKCFLASTAQQAMFREGPRGRPMSHMISRLLFASSEPKVIGFLLYLEDFFVVEEFRGKAGRSVLAMKTRCGSMHFIVAEDNRSSIEFYKRRGAEDLSKEEGWRLFRFDKDSILKMAAPAEE
uniref:Diamine acetyltransferase 1 n=1 Tax=Gadus morhua TaxID=8049 RepID=A0A8C5BJG2_GADMO